MQLMQEQGAAKSPSAALATCCPRQSSTSPQLRMKHLCASGRLSTRQVPARQAFITVHTDQHALQQVLGSPMQVESAHKTSKFICWAERLLDYDFMPEPSPECPHAALDLCWMTVSHFSEVLDCTSKNRDLQTVCC